MDEPFMWRGYINLVYLYELRDNQGVRFTLLTVFEGRRGLGVVKIKNKEQEKIITN